jgi:hypothetical protein
MTSTIRRRSVLVKRVNSLVEPFGNSPCTPRSMSQFV